MMLDNTQTNALYHAPAAHYLRAVRQSKRYQAKDIVAHTVEPGDISRSEVESFIAAVFKQSYGANITVFMPDLVALRDQDGVLMGAFGLEKAGANTLFLEQYFTDPVETLFAKNLGIVLAREAITSIGNFAVANPRNAGVLIAHVIQHALAIGTQWCVATAHHSLQNGLVKAGRDVYPLHAAKKSTLPLAEQSNWGSYYDKPPQVVAIRGIANDVIDLGATTCQR